ncbi:MAG: YlxR family protein [Lachnospiraceae bacterium]|nr:YlxR family protein [Lachnospiraceae bacterium]
MEKKIPMRQCVGCRTSRDKRDLIRVVRTPEGDIQLDFKGKMNGRGAYLCKDPECLTKAGKNKGLERALNLSVPEEIIDRLKEELKIAK